MTIGPRFPLPPAMTPGAGSVDGKAGAEGESIRRTVSGNQFRSLKVEMASVRGALGLAAADKVDAAVEADITTGDALGVQFEAAFCLPPPPMPEALKG